MSRGVGGQGGPMDGRMGGNSPVFYRTHPLIENASKTLIPLESGSLKIIEKILWASKLDQISIYLKPV